MNVHPLYGARKRIERADKHLNEIISEVEAYALTHQNNITLKYDEIRNNSRLHFVIPQPLPITVALAVSDCIHNLRAALDYLIFELSREDSGDPDPSGTQFPITTEDEFIKHRKARLKNKGPLRYLTLAHIDAIEAYQPYKGINWTQTMRDISNPDKHREITVIGDRADTLISGGAGEVFKGAGVDRSDVQMERKTTVTIAFRDGRPVIETLEILKQQVSLVIDSFSPEFKV